MSKRRASLTVEQVQGFEQVQSPIRSLFDEVSQLAKKAPDAPLNQFKVSIVNERLVAANAILAGIHRPFADFDRFDPNELPTASDAAVVLSQYLNSLEGWRSANVVIRNYNWYWDAPGDYRADAPSRFKTREED
jgi:hypothetical protein